MVLLFVMCSTLLLIHSIASVSFQRHPYVSYIDGQNYRVLAIGFTLLAGTIWLHIWIFLTMKKAYSFILHKRFSTIYRCANVPHIYHGCIGGE
uniref:Uncharacterized protein n=1 Tax=Plectus sambesii TaxID=2011161 RepID=A0A914UQ85_9BILA